MHRAASAPVPLPPARRRGSAVDKRLKSMRRGFPLRTSLLCMRSLRLRGRISAVRRLTRATANRRSSSSSRTARRARAEFAAGRQRGFHGRQPAPHWQRRASGGGCALGFKWTPRKTERQRTQQLLLGDKRKPQQWKRQRRTPIRQGDSGARNAKPALQWAAQWQRRKTAASRRSSASGSLLRKRAAPRKEVRGRGAARCAHFTEQPQACAGGRRKGGQQQAVRLYRAGKPAPAGTRKSADESGCKTFPGLNPGRKLIVAIDGPAGAGKSTIARHLARHFGLLNLETGAMYRAFALKALRAGMPLDESSGLEGACRGNHHPPGAG